MVARWAHRVLVLAPAEIALVVYWAATAPATAAVGANTRIFLAVPMLPVLLGALALTDGPVARVLGTPGCGTAGASPTPCTSCTAPDEIALVAMTRIPALAPDTAAAALRCPPRGGVGAARHLAYRWVEEPAQAWMRDKDPSRRRGSARRDVAEVRGPEATPHSGGRTVGRRGGSQPWPAAAAAGPGVDESVADVRCPYRYLAHGRRRLELGPPRARYRCSVALVVRARASP